MFDLQTAIQSARRLHQSGAGSVLDILIRSTGLPSNLLAKHLQRAGVEMVDVATQVQLDFSILEMERARAMSCVPLRITGKDGICLAVADPWREDWTRKASSTLGYVPQFAATTNALLDYWLGSPPAPHPGQSRFSEDASTNEQGPVVSFVDSAIRSAFASGASDIHFECSRTGVRVKFRQDGVMVPYAAMEDFQKAEEVISRIKVLAQLDITERRTPQDGRFRFETALGYVDLRVSIMPSVFGEDAVLRLLDKAQLRSKDSEADEANSVSLDMLGFEPNNAQLIRELAELPHGLLLVTGPTGSGKTTTVYAVLSEINTGIEKIITIEDPVEYELPGVLQIPVNERKGLTFAKGLRSILRHDPDRILVGEIRDAETAEIAVQSALTGHQVFTTVHANSIFDVTGRFRHFDLDMFGFMSSLNGVIVQRLVRKVCPNCVDRRTPTEREKLWLLEHNIEVQTVPFAVGCEACHNTGYQGRFVLAEVHAVDDAFRDLVIANHPVSALREHVLRQGVLTLTHQAAQHVRSGTTTPQEIKRVVGWK